MSHRMTISRRYFTQLSISFCLFCTMTLKLISRNLWMCSFVECFFCSIEDTSMDKHISAILYEHFHAASHHFPPTDNGLDFVHPECIFTKIRHTTQALYIRIDYNLNGLVYIKDSSTEALYIKNLIDHFRRETSKP